MTEFKFRSIIDLLDSFFGEDNWSGDSLDLLSHDDLDSLAEGIDSHYDSYSPPSAKHDMFRSYSGGATFAPIIRAMYTDGRPQPKIVHSSLLPFTHATALYMDQIVVNCPLDSWIFSYRDFVSPGFYRGLGGIQVQPTAAHEIYGAGFRHSEEAENLTRMKDAIAQLSVLAPAIREGWVLPVPHLRIWKKWKERVATQLRYDLRNQSLLDTLSTEYKIPPAQSDFIRGMQIAPAEGVIPEDHVRWAIESPMIYFNNALAVADATEARFLPTADSDYGLLRQRIDDAGILNKSIRDGLAISSLTRTTLPSFEPIAFETICSIRRNEASFADWRKGIRNLAKGNSPINNSDLTAYQSIVDAEVETYVQGIKADIEKSKTIRGRLESFKPDPIDVGIAATTWAIPPESPWWKLIGSIAAPLLKRAVQSVVSQRQSAQSVIIKLSKKR